MNAVTLPTEQEVREALWEFLPYDARVDAIQLLFSRAIEVNKPETEEDFDHLYEAVAERFHEVIG